MAGPSWRTHMLLGALMLLVAGVCWGAGVLVWGVVLHGVPGWWHAKSSRALVGGLPGIPTPSMDGWAPSLTCGDGQSGKMEMMSSGELHYCDGEVPSRLSVITPTQKAVKLYLDCLIAWPPPPSAPPTPDPQ